MNIKPLSAWLVACLLVASCGESKIKKHLEQGEKLYEEGKYDEAKVEFLNLRQRDPLNAVAHARLGEIWLYQGSAIQAVPFLLEARKLDPDSLDVRVHLAEASLSLGARLDARKYATEVLDKEPAHPRALLLLAESAWSKELIEETRSVLSAEELAESPDAAVGRAFLHARARHVGKADPEVEKALALDAEHQGALLMKGKILQLRKENEEAAKYFKKAAEVGRPRAGAKLEYAKFLLQVGKKDEAISYCRDLVDEVPDYMGAWVILAEQNLIGQNIAEAEKDLENVLRRDPLHFGGRMAKSAIQLAKGEMAEALENLKELRSVYTANSKLEHRVALAFLTNGIPSLAIEALERSLQLQPGDVEVRLLKANLDIRMAEPERVVESMIFLLSNLQPDYGPAQILLAHAYAMLGRLNDAQKIFEERIEKNGDDFQAHMFLGVILRQKQDFGGARKMFEAALNLDQESMLPSFQLVDLDVLSKEPDKALKRIQSILAKDPESADTYVMLGRVQGLKKSWKDAETSFLKAIELNENHLGAYQFLVRSYMLSNQLGAAEAKLQEVVVKSPQDLSSIIQLAMVQDQAGKLEKAELSYERALKLAPSSPIVLNNLAWFYADKMKDLAKAAKIGQRARSALPEEGAIADTLGWIYYLQKDYTRAIALLREAVGKLPTNAEVQYHLGATAYMMAHREEARRALSMASKAAQGFAGQEHAKVLLARLEGVQVERDIAELDELLKAQPEDVVLLLELAGACVREGEFEKARGAYEKVISINPKQMESVLGLATLFLEHLNQPKQAGDYARRARALDSRDGRPLAILGRIELEEGRPKEASALLSQAIRAGVADPVVHHAQAWATYRTGDLERASTAMKSYQGSLKKASPEAKLFLELIDPKAGTQLRDKAKAALQENPEHLPAAFLLAKIAREEGAVDVVKQFEVILLKNPDFVPGKRELAIIYQQKGIKLKEALKLALVARRSYPSDKDLALALAGINYRLEDYRSAVALLRNMGARDALSAEATFYLGASLLGQDAESPDGVGLLRKALTMNLLDSLSKEARQLIDEHAKAN